MSAGNPCFYAVPMYQPFIKNGLCISKGERYQHEHRRLKDWDYTSPASYFITICCLHKEHFFGEVVDAIMHKNDIGDIAHAFWAEIPLHHQHVALDTFIIMPHHMHGILHLHPFRATRYEESHVLLSHQSNHFGPLKTGSLQAVIHSYKSAVTRWCKKNGNEEFGWQGRFYERQLRTPEALDQCRHYIANNPKRWDEKHQITRL